MKHRILFATILAVILSSIYVFGQEVKPKTDNEKKEVKTLTVEQLQQSYQNEIDRLNSKTLEAMKPYKAALYDLQQQTKRYEEELVNLQKQNQKEQAAMLDKYTKLIAEAQRKKEVKKE